MEKMENGENFVLLYLLFWIDTGKKLGIFGFTLEKLLILTGEKCGYDFFLKSRVSWKPQIFINVI